ncbi:hypothetical protein PLANTIT3_80139 [Plantibacter sp. T3]|nr:hypothetical protein PLANTIT3_80139 [Plantibacter sp. T3]
MAGMCCFPSILPLVAVFRHS